MTFPKKGLKKVNLFKKAFYKVSTFYNPSNLYCVICKSRPKSPKSYAMLRKL